MLVYLFECQCDVVSFKIITKVPLATQLTYIAGTTRALWDRIELAGLVGCLLPLPLLVLPCLPSGHLVHSHALSQPGWPLSSAAATSVQSQPVTYTGAEAPEIRYGELAHELISVLHENTIGVILANVSWMVCMLRGYLLLDYSFMLHTSPNLAIHLHMFVYSLAGIQSNEDATI